MLLFFENHIMSMQKKSFLDKKFINENFIEKKIL